MNKKKNKLSPWYVTGFVDGEGCFSLMVRKDRRKRGNFVSIYHYWVTDFAISLRESDVEILKSIKGYFGCGALNKLKKPESVAHSIHFKVRSRKDIVFKIIPHFEKFPLQAQKKLEFGLWQEAVFILYKADKRRKHPFASTKLKDGEKKRLEEIRILLRQRLTGGHLRNALRKRQIRGKIIEGDNNFMKIQKAKVVK